MLFTPISLLISLGETIQDAVYDEFYSEKADIVVQLSGLHRLLEAQQISVAEFDNQEKILLDRLDTIEKFLGE